MALDHGWVSIPSGRHTVRAYHAKPAGAGKRPIVLVMHQIYGVNDYTMDVCRRLAKAGYFALIPELYDRYGSPKGMTKDEIRANLAPLVEDADMLQDIEACYGWCVANGGDRERSAITGFAWGAQFVWLACAKLPWFHAGVVWYGRLVRVRSEKRPTPWREVAAGIRAPILGIFAGEDPGISSRDLEDMREALTRAPVRTEFAIYPDAIHGFHADYQPFYRPEDAKDAWKRMMAWLWTHGVA